MYWVKHVTESLCVYIKKTDSVGSVSVSLCFMCHRKKILCKATCRIQRRPSQYKHVLVDKMAETVKCCEAETQSDLFTSYMDFCRDKNSLLNDMEFMWISRWHISVGTIQHFYCPPSSNPWKHLLNYISSDSNTFPSSLYLVFSVASS